MLQEKHAQREIACIAGISRRTVRDLQSNILNTVLLTSKKLGNIIEKRCTTKRGDRRIVAAVLENRFATKKILQSSLEKRGIHVSKTTLL